MKISEDYTRHGFKHTLLPSSFEEVTMPSILGDSDNIYHYTSVSGLESILKNKKLWFTNIRYLNDRNEVNVGIEHLARITSNLFSEMDEGSDYSEFVNNDAEKLKLQDFQTYICCFSIGKDELSLWNYYTKNVNSHGYNIGFNYKHLIYNLLKKNPELENCTITFGLIDYCINNQIHNKNANPSYIDTMGEGLIKVWESIKNPDLNINYDELDNNIKVLRYDGPNRIFRTCHLPELVYFLKRDYFYAEKEFRIVICVPNDTIEKFINEQQAKYKFRNQNGVLTPYLELDFDASSIIGITSAPTNNGELLDKSIIDFCKACSINIDDLPEGISHSNIPLRF